MANTIKFGNGQWATKEDSILAYNDENANFKPLPFVTSRASTATRVNKAGLLETVASGVPRVDYLDNSKGSYLLEPTSRNLITQSESFGNNYWTNSGASIEGDASTAGVEKVVNGDFATDTDWTFTGSGVAISGGTLNFTSTTREAEQTTSIVDNKIYKVSYDVLNYVSGSVRVELGSGVGVARTSNGSYVEYITASGTSVVQIDALSTFTGSINNVSVKEVSGFSAPSVDNPTSAFKLVGDGTNSSHFIRHTYLAGTALATYAYSFYVKKGEITKIGIRDDVQTGAYISFDLTTKSIISSASMTLTYDDLGDYLRLKVVSAIGSNGTIGFHTYMLDDAYSSGAINGSRVIPNGSGFYIFGAQLEQQSYATSYIPTKGSQISRLSETASQTVPDGIINSSEGVLYFEGSGNLSGTNRYISLSNGSSDRVNIFFDTFNNLRGFVNGISSINGGVTITDNFKCAFKYKSGDIAFWVNGVEVGTSAQTLSLNGLDRLYFDINGSGGNKFNGNCKDLKVYDQILTDAELVKLTTI